MHLSGDTRRTWPRHMHAFHTADSELGLLAARSPTLLVLTHGIWAAASNSALIAGVRFGGCRGPVSIGRDRAQ